MIRTPEEEERNRIIKAEIEETFDSADERPLLVVGDFNGHIQCLGYQREDTNGSMIMTWLNKYNIVLLNLDEKTKGTVTWQREDQKSTIDYEIVNNEMHQLFESMEIDKTGEHYDLSDQATADIISK